MVEKMQFLGQQMAGPSMHNVLLSEKLHFFDHICFMFLVIVTSFVDLQKYYAPFWNRQTILNKQLRQLAPPDGSVILKKCGLPKKFIFFDLPDFTFLVVVTSLVDSQECYTPFQNRQTILFKDLLKLMSLDGSVMLKKCGLPKNCKKRQKIGFFPARKVFFIPE